MHFERANVVVLLMLILCGCVMSCRVVALNSIVSAMLSALFSVSYPTDWTQSEMLRALSTLRMLLLNSDPIRLGWNGGDKCVVDGRTDGFPSLTWPKISSGNT